MKPIQIIRHASAADIVQAHNQGIFQRMKADGIEVSDGEMQWGDGEFALNDAQIIEHLSDAGFWAFADTWTNTIHVWFEARIDERTRLEVMAHEFAHLTGKPCKDEAKEEQRCDAFAEQVMHLFTLWQQVK